MFPVVGVKAWAPENCCSSIPLQERSSRVLLPRVLILRRARKCGAQLSARWPGKGRRGRGACRPACVVGSITAVLSCKDQPIASGNCRDCALTPHSYIIIIIYFCRH